jgi:hypothetical protein
MAYKNYKKKETLLDIYFRLGIIIFPIYALIVGIMIISNEEAGFWCTIPGFIVAFSIFFAIPTGIILLYKRYIFSKVRRIDADPLLSSYLDNFITRFGLNSIKGEDGWKYRGYLFGWGRLDATRDFFKEKGLKISNKTLREIIKHHVDAREKDLTIRQSLPVGVGVVSERKFSSLSGSDFELLLKRLFEAKGYIADLSGGVGDQGCDLVIQKGDRRIAVQAKAWRGHVGNEAVMQVVSSKKMYNCPEAMVVATSDFSREAHAAAKANDVILVGIKELRGELFKYLGESWR